MKKFFLILISTIVFISCEKINPVPLSSLDNLSDCNSKEDSEIHGFDPVLVYQKSTESDFIIDPNGRDDIGSKKDKKSK